MSDCHRVDQDGKQGGVEIRSRWEAWDLSPIAAVTSEAQIIKDRPIMYLGSVKLLLANSPTFCWGVPPHHGIATY
jgi:hypothetical protein